MNQEEATFEQAILTSWNEEQGSKSYVFFSSPTCIPCGRMKETLESIDDAQKLGVFFINVYHAAAIAVNSSVRSVPTLVRFEQGRETARVVGEQSADKLREFLGL